MQQVAPTGQLAQPGCSEHDLGEPRPPRSASACERRPYLDKQLTVYLADQTLSFSARDMTACRGSGTTIFRPLAGWSTPLPVFLLNFPMVRYCVQVGLRS